jgi:hypothetical protein
MVIWPSVKYTGLVLIGSCFVTSLWILTFERFGAIFSKYQKSMWNTLDKLVLLSDSTIGV